MHAQSLTCCICTDDLFIRARSEWDRFIIAVASLLAYTVEAIDPANHRPDSLGERPPFRARRLAMPKPPVATAESHI